LLIGSVVGTRMFEPAAAQPPRLTEGKETPVRDANEPAKAKDSPERPVDALGDPLPPGALMRLGTRRHRVQTWPLTWHGPADGRSYLVHQRLGTRDEIRRLDADSGRVLETWPVPDKHHAVGFSPDGRQVLMSTGFIFYTGLRRPGQKEEQEWVLTLYDLGRRQAVWEQRAMLEEKDWKHGASACFSAEGKWMPRGGRHGRGALRLGDAASGKELWNCKPDGQVLEPLGFAGGGNTLVLRGHHDNSICLFDRDTGRQRRSFQTMAREESRQC